MQMFFAKYSEALLACRYQGNQCFSIGINAKFTLVVFDISLQVPSVEFD